MISNDNCTWTGKIFLPGLYKDKPELWGPQSKLISYLPLSHIAGLAFDILSHIEIGFNLHFAKPDAL
jgi:long-subunit acyl-CoA synthetase (AMP-forming)